MILIAFKQQKQKKGTLSALDYPTTDSQQGHFLCSRLSKCLCPIYYSTNSIILQRKEEIKNVD